MHHAKTVLLVYNGQPQPVEAHVFLDQRMGTDHDLHLPLFKQAVDLLFSPGLDLASEERDRHFQFLSQREQGTKVLLGQQLGRRHECDLITAVERGQGGKEGHDRFA